MNICHLLDQHQLARKIFSTVKQFRKLIKTKGGFANKNKREQFAQTVQRRDIKSSSTVVTPDTKREFDAISAINPLRGQTVKPTSIRE
ncbi:hypothetical protein NFHSH190041_16990 [Shewanella sp. NFH-SH190041]|nr:hypothetical protein NFHSH190041_16990 [Shewanella sp. NFH-SH190041]